MNEKVERKPTSSYKEVRIGNTIYRVTSVFTGEKDLGRTWGQVWSSWLSAALWRTWPLPLLTSSFSLPYGGWQHPCIGLCQSV